MLPYKSGKHGALAARDRKYAGPINHLVIVYKRQEYLPTSNVGAWFREPLMNAMLSQLSERVPTMCHHKDRW